MDSYQNTCIKNGYINRLYECIEFIVYINAIFFKHSLVSKKKKLRREKYCFYYQRTTNSTRREKQNETLPKAGLDLTKLVRGGMNLKKT